MVVHTHALVCLAAVAATVGMVVGEPPSPAHFDVLVVGANAAGVAAAVTASNDNRFTVKVVEPLEMIGAFPFSALNTHALRTRRYSMATHIRCHHTPNSHAHAQTCTQLNAHLNAGGMAAAGGVALMNQGGCGLTGLSRNWSMLCGEVSLCCARPKRSACRQSVFLSVLRHSDSRHTAKKTRHH